MSKFILEPDMETKRYKYIASDTELDLMKEKKVVSFSIGPDGIYCTYTKNNKFVEQPGRYLTLYEALMALD